MKRFDDRMRVRQMRRAIFLDKDGTLVENVPLNVDLEQMRLLAGADKALPLLQSQNYELVVATNQPSVELGRFDENHLHAVRSRLDQLIGEFGAHLDGFYFCPHAPAKDGKPKCDCRKPRLGLLREAAEDRQIELSESWMIGDILDDVEAGNRAGCRTILIDNGNETEWKPGPFRQPNFRARDLAEAAAYILEDAPAKSAELAYREQRE